MAHPTPTAAPMPAAHKHTAPSAAPVVRTTPIVQHATPITTPITTPRAQHPVAPVQRTVYQPASAQRHQNDYRHQPDPRYGYRPQSTSYYPQSRPYYYQQPSFFESLLGIRRPQSYGPAYGPTGMPYNNGALPDPFTPAKFRSFMNAAMDGRENDRVTLRTNITLPTTPEERRMFKQITHALMQQGGRQMDPTGLFTPEALEAVRTGRLNPQSLGSDLRHFSDSFAPSANAAGQRADSPFAIDVRANEDFLRASFANEYMKSREYQAQQQYHREQPHTANYSTPYNAPHNTPYGYAPRSTIIPIFGIRI